MTILKRNPEGFRFLNALKYTHQLGIKITPCAVADRFHDVITNQQNVAFIMACTQHINPVGQKYQVRHTRIAHTDVRFVQLRPRSVMVQNRDREFRQRRKVS
ncbi:hypothetical protein ACSG7X_002954 [Vibrio fluvialis]